MTQTTKEVSTIQVTYTTVICNKCAMTTSEIKPGPTGSVPPQSPQPPALLVPGSGCPETVPRCLNTWLFATECADNADADCYCKLDGFVNNVVGCVQAWGSDDEFENAVSFFAGICAKYIPQNPAIITAIPCPLTAGYTPPAPAATTAAAYVPPPPNVPLTTITASVPCTGTMTVSATYTAASALASGTMSYCSTVVIIPQVALVQQPSSGVVLFPGPQTNAPAYTTSVVGPAITKSYVPVPTGSVIPTSPIPFTGAAASTSPSSAAALAGVIGGLLMLVFQL